VTEHAIVAEGLLKRYGDVTALRDISFDVPRGTITGFVGRNGAGKTTTLKILSTLLRSDDGHCRVFDLDVKTHRRDIRQRIGFLPDLFELPATLALREYLSIFAELYGIGGGDRAKRVATTLQLTRTDELGERRMNALSRGEQQRVGLARALIHNPDLLLLDEPAAGLDLGAREALLRTLGRLAADPEAPALVLVSHHVEEVPAGFTHALMLRDGEVVSAGPIRDVMRSSQLSACFGLPLLLFRHGERYTARAALLRLP
jgi:iron complex transport system ATP-binding protein